MRDIVSYLMDEIWERAVEMALNDEKDHTAARTLTLDGAVKCIQGWLPPPSLLERFQNLQHLSIASIGISSLEQFPRLWNLERLIFSDNMIADGLEFLVEAGLDSLRDLDLSNNRIRYIGDLAPLTQLKLVSLDLYECPVTHVKDYRSRVFRLIKSLKYLDKMDAQENERPESADDDDDEEENEDEEDPGSEEIDGEDKQFATSNGHGEGVDGVVDVDAKGEGEVDEEEMETLSNGSNHLANGFRVELVEEDGEDENDSGEEIDEEDGDGDDDVHVDGGSGVFVEVHEIVDNGDDYDDDDEGDGDGDGGDDDDDDGDEVMEGGNIEEVEFALEELEGRGLFLSMDGEIDGHEQGEEDVDEDDNGETGEEEEMRVEYDREFEDDDEEEDCGAGYLVQPVGHSEALNAGSGSMNGGKNDDEEEEVDDDDNDAQVLPPPFSNLKRKRDNDDDDDDEQ